MPQPLCMTEYRGTGGSRSAAGRSPRPGAEGRAQGCGLPSSLPPSTRPGSARPRRPPFPEAAGCGAGQAQGGQGMCQLGLAVPGKEAREDEAGQAWGGPAEGLHGESTQVTRRQREGGRGHRSPSIRSRHGSLDRRSALDTAAKSPGLELGVSSGRAGEQDGARQPETCRAAVAFTGQGRETRGLLRGQHTQRVWGQHFSGHMASRGGCHTVSRRLEEGTAPGQLLGA